MIWIFNLFEQHMEEVLEKKKICKGFMKLIMQFRIIKQMILHQSCYLFFDLKALLSSS
jgi:hypothetical protein